LAQNNKNGAAGQECDECEHCTLYKSSRNCNVLFIQKIAFYSSQLVKQKNINVITK